MERLCPVFQRSPVNEQVTRPAGFLLIVLYKDMILPLGLPSYGRLCCQRHRSSTQAELS